MMQSEYTHGLPSPSQPSQNFSQHGFGQGNPSHNSALQGQQRGPQNFRDTYQYQHHGGVVSPVQPYNGLPAGQHGWGSSSQPMQENMQPWPSSAAPANAPPPTYNPTSLYNPSTYGPMPGVRPSSVGPPSYYARPSSDTSGWGVKYKQQHESSIDQGFRPPLPPRPMSVTQTGAAQYTPQQPQLQYASQHPPQEPNPGYRLDSYNLASSSQFAPGNYPPPPPPPPKTPQDYHRDPPHDQPPVAQHSLYQHEATHQAYPSTIQPSQYIQQSTNHQFSQSASYPPAPQPPASQNLIGPYPSASSYSYQTDGYSGGTQPQHAQSLVSLSSPTVERRDEWASVADQTYRPAVSPPLQDPNFHANHEVYPNARLDLIPPSPTSIWSFEQQQQQMQAHTESPLQTYPSIESQQIFGHAPGPESHQRQDSSQIPDVSVVSEDSVSDTKVAATTDNRANGVSMAPSRVTAASALGYGGPSDWEHFDIHAEEEIDDTELFRRKGDVVTEPLIDTAELPSISTPPPNENQHTEIYTAEIEPEQGPTSSTTLVLPSHISSSNAGQITSQTNPPSDPTPTSAATTFPIVSSAPARSTITDSTSSNLATIQATHSKQLGTDGVMLGALEQSIISAGEEAPMLSGQSHTNDSEVDSQPQAISQLQTSTIPKSADSGKRENQRTIHIEPGAFISQPDALNEDEVFGDGQKPLSVVIPAVSSIPETSSTHNAQPQTYRSDDSYTDLDSWARASLSRYVVMLRGEASANTDLERLRLFTSFMSKEYLLRAVLYGATPEISSAALKLLAQPSPETTGHIPIDKRSSDEVLLITPQTESMPPRPNKASFSDRGSPSPPPNEYVTSLQVSTSHVQSLTPAASVPPGGKDSTPHQTESLHLHEGRLSSIGGESLQLDKNPSFRTEDDLMSTREPSLPDIKPLNLRKDFRKSQELTSAETVSTPRAQTPATQEGQMISVSSGADSVNGSDSESDVQRSPGGRPIVTRPSRGPLHNQQSSKGAEQLARPIDEIVKRANGDQGRYGDESHSPGANAPIVIDGAWDSPTCVRPGPRASARQTPSPVLPEVANERPAYTPYRYTEVPSSRLGQGSHSQPIYKAYSAPGQSSDNGPGRMSSQSPVPVYGAAPESASQQGDVHSTSGLTNAIAALRGMLPADRIRDPAVRRHTQIAAIAKDIENVRDDFSFIKKTVVTWDAEVKKSRERHERERRVRQEQSEERIDGLFHDNEIGYSDIGALEAEFKRSEAEKRAQEEKEEYESFVRGVFEVVTGKIQREINHLSSQYNTLVGLLPNTFACKDTFQSQEDRPEISQVLVVILILHAKLETRHRKTLEAHLERDRRLRKTQLTPLYSEGRVAEMKKLEKGFDITERETVLEATQERAHRASKLTHIVDDHTMRGIRGSQEYITAIAKTASTIDGAMSNDSTTDELTGLREDLTLASSILSSMLANSTMLSEQAHAADVILNDADFEVSVAKARVINADAETIQRLTQEKDREDLNLKQELQQRISTIRAAFGTVIDQVEALASRIANPKSDHQGIPVPEGTELEHEGRIQRALEQAKKRNRNEWSEVG